MEHICKNKLSHYYNERAAEYDEIYEGKGPAIPGSEAYKKDVAEIIKIAAFFGAGHLLDIGCGTGFWLPHYAPNCSKIMLMDQAEKMLSECGSKIKALELGNKCRLVQADFFKYNFGSSRFDSAVAGFFISHLTAEQERAFFAKLKKILKPNARILIIDSAWSETRKPHRKKEGIQKRTLNNGRTFTIYKRYFDMTDLKAILKMHHFKPELIYYGNVFLCMSAERLD